MWEPQQFAERAIAKHGNRFLYDAVVYAGYRQPITIACREHGSFATTPKYHLSSRSGGCHACRRRLTSRSLRLTGEEFLSKAKEKHGDRYCYDEVQYVDRNTSVRITCPEHGTFSMRPSRHLEGRGCRLCAFSRFGDERRIGFWEFVGRVTEAHGEGTYEYEISGLVNLHSQIQVRCPEHGQFMQEANAHLRGAGCSSCRQSRGETAVREALLDAGVEFQEQVRFTECRHYRQLPFDFYVPRLQLLIEFDGRQHFERSELWGGELALRDNQRRDEIKAEFAQSHHYRLLRIPFTRISDVEAIVWQSLAESVTQE